MRRFSWCASILAATLFVSSAVAQTAPQTGPSPASARAPSESRPWPPAFHRQGVAFLDLAPSGIGVEAGVSWGRQWQIGLWAGGYFPWFGEPLSAAPEAYVSFSYQWARDGALYTALYVGAGARLPDPGRLSLRTFAVVTTTHRVSGFIAATAFHTPRSWYPNTLSEDGWFFSFRAGPTIMAIPGRLKFQGYVEVTHIPGVPMARPAPGFTALVFF